MFRRISRILIVFILVAWLASIAAAQSVLSVKLGTLNPKDAQPGFIVGITTAKQVDERVDFGLGVDLFVRKYTEMTEVDSGGGGSAETDPSIFQTNIDYSVFALPIMVQLHVRILPYAVVRPYISLGGGYEIVFSREANYETGDKDSRLYGGFGWQLMIGGEYQIGSASFVLAEIFYNGCTVKRGKGTSELGYPLHEELDFSGLGFRIGVKFDRI